MAHAGSLNFERYPALPMVIVDLSSQRDAVANSLRAIESSGQLDWLRIRGELIVIPMPDSFPPAFIFRSTAGIETKFTIRDGVMIFLGDHSTNGAVRIQA